MSIRVPIKQEVLRWAIAKTGLDVDDLAHGSLLSIHSWLVGETQPTIRQAEELAKKAGIPYPLLLLDTPLETPIDLPDFRTLGSATVVDPSPELEQVIKDCTARLDWYVDFARAEDIASVDLLSSFSLSDNALDAAEQLRSTLNWYPEHTVKTITKLTDAIEGSGALVMRSALVKNNTHRKLDKDEFSGFTLIDNNYTLIFINAAETKSAQLFSLAHELGHVVLGEASVSDDDRLDGNQAIERWCNLFAAEFLIPAKYFREIWNASFTEEDAIKKLSHRTGASPEAVVWKGVDSGIVERNQAPLLIQACSYSGPQKKPTGGDGLNNIRPRIGRRFLAATAAAIGTDLLSISDAMYYLGTSKRETVRDLMEPQKKAA